MWTCPPTIHWTGALQNLSDRACLQHALLQKPSCDQIGADTKHFGGNFQKPRFPLNSAAAQAGWRFYRSRAKGLLKIPFVISTINQTLIGAYLPITHLSCRVQDHKWQPVILSWLTFARAWLCGWSFNVIVDFLLWFSFTAFSLFSNLLRFIASISRF